MTNKRDPHFNMSSLTDIIFLLIIFFLLTSNFVTPNGLDLVLPSSNSQALAAEEPISVSISEDEEYMIDNETITIEQLGQVLTDKVANKEKATIVLYSDKNVPIEKAIEVMNIAKSLNTRMILATNPLEEE